MNFKPTKWKIIVSIVVTILWVILINLFNLWIHASCVCPSSEIMFDIYCPADPNYVSMLIVKPLCKNCLCISLSDMLVRNSLNLITPFAIVYIIWSLIEKSKSKSKNKAIKITKRAK